MHYNNTPQRDKSPNFTIYQMMGKEMPLIF